MRFSCRIEYVGCQFAAYRGGNGDWEMFLSFKPFLFLSLFESISYLLKNEYDVVEEEVPNGEVVIHHLSDKIVTILSQSTDHIKLQRKKSLYNIIPLAILSQS